MSLPLQPVHALAGGALIGRSVGVLLPSASPGAAAWPGRRSAWLTAVDAFVAAAFVTVFLVCHLRGVES